MLYDSEPWDTTRQIHSSIYNADDDLLVNIILGYFYLQVYGFLLAQSISDRVPKKTDVEIRVGSE